MQTGCYLKEKLQNETKHMGHWEDTHERVGILDVAHVLISRCYIGGDAAVTEHHALWRGGGSRGIIDYRERIKVAELLVHIAELETDRIGLEECRLPLCIGLFDTFIGRKG